MKLDDSLKPLFSKTAWPFLKFGVWVVGVTIIGTSTFFIWEYQNKENRRIKTEEVKQINNQVKDLVESMNLLVKKVDTLNNSIDKLNQKSLETSNGVSKLANALTDHISKTAKTASDIEYLKSTMKTLSPYYNFNYKKNDSVIYVEDSILKKKYNHYQGEFVNLN